MIWEPCRLSSLRLPCLSSPSFCSLCLSESLAVFCSRWFWGPMSFLLSSALVLVRCQMHVGRSPGDGEIVFLCPRFCHAQVLVLSVCPFHVLLFLVTLKMWNYKLLHYGSRLDLTRVEGTPDSLLNHSMLYSCSFILYN